MMDYKIIDKIWFTAFGIDACMGIITIEFEYDGKLWRKAYIGNATGYNEEADSMAIVESGARFHGFTVDIIKSNLINEMP